MSLFWLLHLFHIYLSIVFPIESRFLKTKKWSQRLHITEVVVSVFISALCPAVVLVTNINYNFIFYPALFCTPATQVLIFYSMAIPVVLITVIGLNLIVTVVWTLFKVSCMLMHGTYMLGTLLKCYNQKSVLTSRLKCEYSIVRGPWANTLYNCQCCWHFVLRYSTVCVTIQNIGKLYMGIATM